MKFLPAQNRHVLSELLAEALRAGFGIHGLLEWKLSTKRLILKQSRIFRTLAVVCTSNCDLNLTFLNFTNCYKIVHQ